MIPAESARPTVCLVHPRGIVRDLYVEALQAAGLRTEIADEASAVLEGFAAWNPPTALVIELVPQPADAWMLIERVRQLHAHVPVVIVTSKIRPDGANRRRARTVGCAAFIGKPCSVETLVDVVERVRRGERGLEVVTG